MSTIHHPTLAADALSLPEAERASLAGLLIDSLDHQTVAELWPESLVEELRRRADDLQSGKVKGLNSEEVFGSAL
jgi:putative addiction module component (TIGR02574 family)